MLRQNGLFCAVKALALITILALSMPVPSFAQSDEAARVKIEGSDEFGEVLLVRDGDDIIIYGLAFSVPPFSQVTVTAGNQEFFHSAAFTGQFPVVADEPIRITGGANMDSADLTIQKNDGSVLNGTVNLNIESPDVLKALQDYLDESRKVIDGTQSSISKGVPPHRLIRLTADEQTDQNLLGHVLMTQRLIGRGQDAFLVDQIEGLSFGGADPPLRSVTPFQSLEFFSGDVDRNNPDLRKRIHTVFGNQGFVINGGFFPFDIIDVNSGNVDQEGIESTISIRVTLDQAQGGRVVWGTLNLDVSAGIVGDPVVINNNQQGNPDAPGADGLAIIQGQADPYSVITAYPGDTRASGVIAQATADASGQFSITIPPAYSDVTGQYVERQQVYLDVLDIFGNSSSTLTEVATDDQSVVFGTPTSTDQGDGTFIIQGTVEPLAAVVITGRNSDGLEFNAGGMFADASGVFITTVTEAQSYSIRAIDQAGNVSDPVAVEGDEATPNPTVDTITGVFPNIRITGTAERNASILVFAFPLDSVPDTADTLATLPEEAFNLQDLQVSADANGGFSLTVPGGISSIIYLQAIDTAGNTSDYVGVELVDENGNPLNRGLIAFDVDIQNKGSGIEDIITGTVVQQSTSNPVSGIFVGAYYRMSNDPELNFPFQNALIDPVPVNNDGKFELSIPETEPISGQFVEEFYLVALDLVQADLTYRDLGFMLIDENEEFDRTGPDIQDILSKPQREDIFVRENGVGGRDTLIVKNTLPAGSGSNSLPAGAIPYIFVLIDENDDNVIDVNSPNIEIVGYQPLLSSIGIPYPGIAPIDLGDNHWDPSSQAVFGRQNYFVALMDEFGNLSPSPFRVELDVTVDDPNGDLIEVRGQSIFGRPGSVEPNAYVSVFESTSRGNLLATTQADANGTFFMSVSLTQEEVYIYAKDTAGNESNALKAEVIDPIKGTQFIILDGFGIMHTPASEMSSGFLSGNESARALAGVPKSTTLAQLNENSPLYVLTDAGRIMKLGESGKLPAESDQFIIPGKFARDLEVISANPFSAYVLLGNGVILTYGDAPFYGDIVQVQRGYADAASLQAFAESIYGDLYDDQKEFTARSRIRLTTGSQFLFDDLDGDGRYYTEDRNGNGILDRVIGPGGTTLVKEDLDDDNKIDAEPLINPEILAQGFENDIARDLELVRDADGNVKGYVILDGFGTMWPFGDDIGAENVTIQQTAGVSGDDIFRAFELVVDADGRIDDFITLNGFGQVFGRPGGPLGAGEAGDPQNAGHLSFKMNATNFGFDIARDIRINPVDSNGDNTIDWKDGYYILTGFGGIQAIGGAPEIEESPFLGLDIARDMEFGSIPR